MKNKSNRQSQDDPGAETPDVTRRPPRAFVPAADAVDGLREALRREVRASSFTQRRIEEDLGWTRGYLSQVLQGHISLTADHLFSVCSVLRLRAADLVAEAEDGPKDPLSEIHERMNEFDRALTALRSKGYLDPSDDDPSDDDSSTGDQGA